MSVERQVPKSKGWTLRAELRGPNYKVWNPKVITHIIHTFTFTHSRAFWINDSGTSVQSFFRDSGLEVVDESSTKTRDSLSEA